MNSSQVSIVAITNLYPVPWAPHRASFNKQQFDLLGQQVKLRVLVLLPWREWFKHRNECQQTAELSYVPYFQLPGFGRSLTPWFQKLAISSKSAWLKISSPTHILASWAFPDAVACLMYAQNKGIKVLVKVHGTDINEHTEHTQRRKIMAKWLAKANTVFCASDALRKKLLALGLPETKVLTNYNGVNATLFYPAQPAADKRVLFIGNLIETKGVFELLEAFGSIAARTDCTLHFIGQGPAANSLREIISQKGWTERVVLHGALPLEDVATQLRGAKLVVLPSYREGVPNVLLEASASGIPVVATAVGGIPEVVTKDTGILVEPRNSNELATAIEQALDRYWQTDVIVKHAARFDWQQNIKNFLARI